MVAPPPQQKCSKNLRYTASVLLLVARRYTSSRMLPVHKREKIDSPVRIDEPSDPRVTVLKPSSRAVPS